MRERVRQGQRRRDIYRKKEKERRERKFWAKRRRAMNSFLRERGKETHIEKETERKQKEREREKESD